MATAIVHAFKPTRSRVLTLVAFLAILFGCYGLLSAQQARSAGTLSKQVWGGVRFTGAIEHQKHITSVSRLSTGQYLVTFDRHVDNCSLQVTIRAENGLVDFHHLAITQGASNSQVRVNAKNAAASAFVDTDFDIFGMCPSS